MWRLLACSLLPLAADAAFVTTPPLRCENLPASRSRPAIVARAGKSSYTLPGLDDAPGGRLARLREVCDLEPGCARARQRAAELVASARGRLERLPDGPWRDALSMLSEFVLDRRW